MSARGSTPKISSLSSMSPPLPAEPESPRVCTLTFILAFLALVSGATLRGRFARRSVRGLVGVRRSARFLLGRDRCDLRIAGHRRDLVDRCVVDQAGVRD